MSKSKLGILLMVIGALFTIFSLTLRLAKFGCCTSFSGVKFGSAINVWVSNSQYNDSACICNPLALVEPNHYYIPVEFIIVGLIIFFIGFRVYLKEKRVNND
ncbi:MAG: hypothetical protein A2406_04030 [Candidatus Komeilibacteria bacterium RIFOXYC1_FULL_37_11]|uniref:Uncharacterized protein n=1 Tax=Candidatus Komeilibacteria bacterium RIFOXYC1_FULL_37_11 TaxID=1798555 RepID=A0A1G2BXP2_9BACT|nr:MAG: hypothetical protein A2406_04030 [Candidatus Komeilibacteria bacterium RIFOXYC1_FULL_37_11]OGY95850.1 MAG: hypothetical protein A2611_03690 [Candidatus Komeilibacteria bacterium RIFOXYD1_FULL_37_29]OGY97357.1 MAG: hypothetical protein A2543_01165 [Candidatus Komeilibacteria bacterium RIFOXYD2_FULL_37_8]